VIEDNLLHLLIHLFLLAENDIALTLNGLGVELRILQNVGENINGSGDIVVEGLGIVDGVFTLFSSTKSPWAKDETSLPKHTDV
jgi:hypothetical protein